MRWNGEPVSRIYRSWVVPLFFVVNWFINSALHRFLYCLLVLRRWSLAKCFRLVRELLLLLLHVNFLPYLLSSSHRLLAQLWLRHSRNRLRHPLLWLWQLRLFLKVSELVPACGAELGQLLLSLIHQCLEAIKCFVKRIEGLRLRPLHVIAFLDLAMHL